MSLIGVFQNGIGKTGFAESVSRLELVCTSVKAMIELRSELFPDPPDAEPYPDRLDQPLVDLPPNK